MTDYQLLKFIAIAAAFATQQLLVFGSACVNGRWEEDTCVCNEGYETVSRITMEPTYCSQRTVVVIHIVNTPPWSHRDVLDITLPIFCVYILGCCCVGVAYTIWQIGLRFWTTENLRRIKLEKANFHKTIKKYKHVKMLDADMWDLPPMDYIVVNSVIGAHVVQYRRAKVLLDYKAQDVEELNLKKGDVIMDIIELENGWWQGDLNGQIGYFPGDYVQFLDNTKKTGSAILMNDPEWTQGIQETAKTFQYKGTDGKKSKRDDEVVSETSSMYLKDLAKVKKSLPKKWLKKPSDDVTSTTKRKTKGKKAKEEEERLLISSDSLNLSSEYDKAQKERHKGRKEKRRKVKGKQEKKQTKDKQERRQVKETLVEDNKLSLTENDSQLFEEKQSKEKKKGSRQTKHGKQTEKKLTKESKQSLPDSGSKISVEQDSQKVKEKEKKYREQSKQKEHVEKQDSKKQSLMESTSDKQNEKRKYKKTQDSMKMPLIENDSSDETQRKEEKQSKQKRKDRMPSDKTKGSTVKTTKSEESVETKQRRKGASTIKITKSEGFVERKQRRKGAKETQSEKQQHEIQTDTSDEKQHKRKQNRAKESKHKEKKTLSDEEFSEIEKPRKQRGRKQRKQSEQKSLPESAESEASIELRKKSKGKTKQKQPKKDVVESSDDDDDDDKPSVTISDIEFLTESEEEKPKKGLFKKLFKL